MFLQSQPHENETQDEASDFEVLANFKQNNFLPSLSRAKEKLKPTYILIREREKCAQLENKKKEICRRFCVRLIALLAMI